MDLQLREHQELLCDPSMMFSGTPSKIKIKSKTFVANLSIPWDPSQYYKKRFEGEW